MSPSTLLDWKDSCSVNQHTAYDRHFQLIAGALLEGKRLHLQYWNREKQERTTRDLSPQRLVHYRENWLLDAWCHEKNALRTFSLEAIEEVRVTITQNGVLMRTGRRLSTILGAVP